MGNVLYTFYRTQKHYDGKLFRGYVTWGIYYIQIVRARGTPMPKRQTATHTIYIHIIIYIIASLAARGGMVNRGRISRTPYISHRFLYIVSAAAFSRSPQTFLSTVSTSRRRAMCGLYKILVYSYILRHDKSRIDKRRLDELSSASKAASRLSVSVVAENKTGSTHNFRMFSACIRLC